jgi:hypothetical protein
MNRRPEPYLRRHDGHRIAAPIKFDAIEAAIRAMGCVRVAIEDEKAVAQSELEGFLGGAGLVAEPAG